VWGHNILRRPGYSDSGQFYLYARRGIHRGWNTLYDVAAQKPIWIGMGGRLFSLGVWKLAIPAGGRAALTLLAAAFALLWLATLYPSLKGSPHKPSRSRHNPERRWPKQTSPR
jgi:hypothetical protein